MKTISWTFMNGIFVSVHSDIPPSDEEWDTQIAECVQAAQAGELRAGFVMTEGRGGPNALQRGRLEEQAVLQKLPVAIITRSLFIRGVVTALRWLNKEMGAFQPSEIHQAFSYLGIEDPAERAEIRHTAARLRRRLLGMSAKVSAEIPDDKVLTTSFPDIRERMQAVIKSLGGHE